MLISKTKANGSSSSSSASGAFKPSTSSTTTTTTTTTDLFDLVKNSNGAISITPTTALITASQVAVATTANTSTFSSSSSSASSTICNSSNAFNLPNTATTTTTFSSQSNNSNFKTLISSCSAPMGGVTKCLENLGKIKDEPMDECVSMVTTAAGTKERDVIKAENPTSFSGQIPGNLKIKQELDLINPVTAMHEEEEEETEKSLSPQPNNMLLNNMHECSSSSSSFSTNSNSISSAADLSLEASTPASITSSEANSPQCSILSPLNNSCHQQSAGTPNPCSNSNSLSDSNSSSNSCATGASSRDMLSEMVTSTCISSDSSESSSISVSLPENEEESKQSLSEDKPASSPTQENDKQQLRDVTTPESGIGGSLSNTESMDSSSKSSTGDNASTSDATESEIINSSASSQSDTTQTPPATPMIQDSQSNDESQNESNNSTESLSSSSSSSSLAPPQPEESSISQITTSCSVSSSSVKSFELLSATNASTTSTTTSGAAATTTTIDTKLAEDNFTKGAATKCAISPILSQPKTIRFPANGGKGNKRLDGVCYWHKCNKKHDSNSKLLDHMQHQHVNTQVGPFSCLWVGCKVYQKESCSRRWLERHVLSHGGSKQFKCIVEGCGLRFGSQLALQKHVNSHFTATENKESTNKRTSDPPVPKQLRKNGKKLRYRRQPFSARMFDFFDAGIMEGLQHRLRQISTLTNGCNSITFQGQCIMKRKTIAGHTECFVQWSPREIISDEWLPETTEPFLKTVNIKQMKPAEKNKIDSLLMTAYKLPYSPTIFENDYALSRQQQQQQQQIQFNNNNTCNNEMTNETEVTANNQEEEEQEGKQHDGDDSDDNVDDEDDDEEDDEEDATTTTTAETISSYQNVLTITNIQMQQRKKHPRKPQNRLIVTR